MGYLQGSIPDLSRLFAENCAEKSFFGRKLGFALGRYLTDKYVAGLNFRAYSYDTVGVEVF